MFGFLGAVAGVVGCVLYYITGEYRAAAWAAISAGWAFAFLIDQD
jgi:hypothetical protein